MVWIVGATFNIVAFVWFGACAVLTFYFSIQMAWNRSSAAPVRWFVLWNPLMPSFTLAN
jgi:hypothetical protein